MKATFAVILILSLLLPGCTDQEELRTAEFYYPRSTYTQDSMDSVIAPEERNRENLATITLLLDQYLQGPLDPKLVNPFPEGTAVVEVYVMGNVTLLTLTDSLAQLEGLDLLLACASISRTVTGITGTPMVQISCKTAKLDGKPKILIASDTIQYLDTVPTEPEEQLTEE